MGEMKRAIAREREAWAEKMQEQTRMKLTLVIAAAIIAAVRLARETRRPVPETIARQVLVDDLLKDPDTLPPNLFEVVVARFECSPMLPFSIFCDGSRIRFCRFVDSFAGEAKPVPPKHSSEIGCHSRLLSFR